VLTVQSLVCISRERRASLCSDGDADPLVLATANPPGGDGGSASAACGEQTSGASVEPREHGRYV
jgi:hypothetical protein